MGARGFTSRFGYEKKEAVNQYVSVLHKDTLSGNLRGWEKRWTKCVELQGQQIN